MFPKEKNKKNPINKQDRDSGLVYYYIELVKTEKE